MADSCVIETDRLQIVPFSEEHLTATYVSWLNDPEVVRYSEQRHRSHTLESCKDYWQSFLKTPNYFWAIVARDARLGHIGNMNAYVDAPNLVADVGIMIGERQVWGLGFGLEAWTAVCGYLLGNVRMRKLTAGCLSVNTAMLRVMHRTGMVEEARLRRQRLFEGQELDTIHTAIFQGDWDPITLQGLSQTNQSS